MCNINDIFFKHLKHSEHFWCISWILWFSSDHEQECSVTFIWVLGNFHRTLCLKEDLWFLWYFQKVIIAGMLHFAYFFSGEGFIVFWILYSRFVSTLKVCTHFIFCINFLGVLWRFKVFFYFWRQDLTQMTNRLSIFLKIFCNKQQSENRNYLSN